MGRNRLIILILAAIGILLVGVYASQLVKEGPGEDRLSDNQVESAQAPRDEAVEQRCSDRSVHDQIKRQLFRQASQMRGSDQAAYDRLAGYALLRVDAATLKRDDQSSGALVCSAQLSLDLPPGVVVAGGRRTLTSDVDFAVEGGEGDASRLTALSNADGIVIPLSTLARTGEAIQPRLPGQADPAAPQPAPTPAPRNEVPPPNVQIPSPPVVPAPPARPQASSRPSFNCANARTRGEIAVCNNDDLAELDRFMASKYVAATRSANAEQRALLQRTRNDFLAYRDQCGNNGCIGEAYRGRMREIDDIMSGRWRGR